MRGMQELEGISEAALRDLFELRGAVDDLIERSLVARTTVAEVMAELLPLVADRLKASAAFVETYGEDLVLHPFYWSRTGAPLGEAEKERVWRETDETHRGRARVPWGDEVIVAQHLDVAGAWFGRAGIVVPSHVSLEQAALALNVVSEVLDNHLYAIRAAREKHTVMMKLGNALRHRVLSEGVKQAVAALAEAVPIDRMVLVYVAEEEASTMLHVQQFEGTKLVLDTMSSAGDTHGPLRMLGREYLRGESDKLLDELGVRNAQEEVLINGITKSVVVGKVVVTAKDHEFNTYDRELLSAFAGFIRQRVVDFNREWRSLAAAFRPDDVARLLSTDGYEQYLAPREATVGIVYMDISGFTRISEQILKEPAKVAALVEAWSRDAVDIVWEHGGVFDKMVGDCIIALFGPPFYDESEGERLLSAIRCAQEVQAMTNALPKRIEFEVLRAEGLALSSGVNLAPLMVGQFGPNENFTGFSSGMNNTARLQGCAGRDEILVMGDAVDKLPPQHGLSLGEERSAPVKNVAEPLKFRAVLP